MSSTEITKTGRVTEVSDGRARVSVACSADECAGCKAAMICGSRGGDVTLEAATGSMSVRDGDQVVIICSRRGWLVSWILIAGLPCVAIMLGLGIGYALGLSEGLTALLPLLAMTVYFIIMYALRRKINGRAQWRIERKLADKSSQPIES